MSVDIKKFIHPGFRYEVVDIGQENQKVVIIDNFVNEPNSLIDYALSHGSVTVASGLYPGVRAPAPGLYKSVVKAALTELICEVFSLSPSNIADVESSYSIVATPREKLSIYQQIPHFDRPRPDEIALLHYLCGTEYGGTSFYRHRNTRYEYIDQGRVDVYKEVVAREIEQGGVAQPAAYINGDTALFEQIGSFKAKFNRCLIYRCSSLHSGDIPLDYAFDMNPRTGRFTITSFMHR